jgi:spore germination cell wall hydrolase CwlJ-like protein
MRILKKLILVSLLCLNITICLAPSLPKQSIGIEQINCLASAIYHESGNQRLQGQQAVAFVIFNRSKKYNLDVCHVVNQTIAGKRQFRWIETKILYKETYNKVVNLATSMYLNPSYYKDNTGNALFFHSRFVNPEWKYKRTVRIQDHIFFTL